MVDRANGRKKSDFVAKDSVDAGAFMDYFVSGVNYKISYDNFVGGLGVTGSIEQDGDPTGTAILDVDGSVNKIRNLENGPGIVGTVSAQNGLKVSHNFTVDGTGEPVMQGSSNQSPVIASLVAGAGITLTSGSGYIEIAEDADPHLDAICSMHDNTTNTVIDATDTPVKVAGTFTADHDSSVVGDTTGRMTYTGTTDAHLTVTAFASVLNAAVATVDMKISLALNGTVVDVSKMPTTVNNTSKRVVSTTYVFEVQTNDYIEVFVENNDSTDNLKVTDCIIRVE